MSFFKSVPQAPADPILGITQAFKADTHPDKLNLGVGAYRDENLKPWVLQSVRTAEAEIVADHSLDKEYLPIDGLAQFLSLTKAVCLGENSAALKEGRVVTVQALSGTGSLRLAAEFVKAHFPAGTEVYISDPTWGNHLKIFQSAGLKVNKYRYYNPETRWLDFDGMMADLKSAKDGSLIILHTCAHNPTGIDPTKEQWQQIADLCKSKSHMALFDTPYQGFASGDLVRDRYAIELFDSMGMEFFVAQSYAKVMGLYGERIGALSVILGDVSMCSAVLSQLKVITRVMISSPPVHGARLVAKILSTPALYKLWTEELKQMADRIQEQRDGLFNALTECKCPGDWNHILKQIGMFAYTGLKPREVELLTERHHIYLTKDGRISMAGLTKAKCVYLAKAMKDVIENQ